MSESEYKLIVHPHEGTPDVIDTQVGLEKAAQLLSKSTMPVAIDVERAVGYRYSHRAYLVQIRREDVGTFLIDSGTLPDLSILNEPLNNAVWILHDADQDIASLRMCGLEIPELFDTMLAARLLGFQRFGLAAVCEQILGVTLDKNHQSDDWSTRPLPRPWLRYAALDVELLTDLYEKMSHSLFKANRWEWAQQEFHNILTRPTKKPDSEPWRNLRGMGKIRSRRHLAILEELWKTRERIAAEIDLEPTRLIKNRTLVALAFNPPRTQRQFLNEQELRRPGTRKYLDEWFAAINRGKSRSEADLPEFQRSYRHGEFPRATAWRSYEGAHARLVHLRDAIRKVSDKLGIDYEILIDTRIIRHIAWYEVSYQGKDLLEFLTRFGARPWQLELVFKPLEKAIKQMP
ncbi:3'-5' exonuclease [Gleimia coleocanis DSM 15436]|uniref:3'-5' exonuclease n=1 Tax=Gleimia coleocanis DSM 15436 TaxID=525245 RepID=C0W1R4_9ACTO|nr:HRDC domain-containing protein [Gleimia coleocanis]EEH63430.1 3'-5' exonuclease [Gleimia coleocanis DSM 15436]